MKFEVQLEYPHGKKPFVKNAKEIVDELKRILAKGEPDPKKVRAEIAQIAKVTPQAVSSWEKEGWPSIEAMNLIVDYLNDRGDGG